MDSEIRIIKLDPHRWEEFKEIRLEALEKEPFAFGISLEEERGRSSEIWIKRLKDSLSPGGRIEWFFAEVGGEIVGMGAIKYARLKKFSHIAKFTGIYVKKDFRKKGIGKMLVNKRLEAAKERGVKKIKITVNQSQKDAQILDRSQGFRLVGTLEKEFFVYEKYYDAYLMEKVI